MNYQLVAINTQTIFYLIIKLISLHVVIILVQPGSVVTVQSQHSTSGPIKVSQASSIMPQTTIKGLSSIHPQMVSVQNPNAGAAAVTTAIRTVTDRGECKPRAVPFFSS